MSYWRDKAQPVIAAAIESGRAAGLEGRALERHVSVAYPFGPREHHPYKIWLSEVRLQLGRTCRRAANETADQVQGRLF